MWNVLGPGPIATNGADSGQTVLPLLPWLADLSEEGPRAWQGRALCAETDPEAFFPEKGGSTREAKAVCGQCEVRTECLDYAMEHDERYGIWGGLSERDRRKLRTQRRAM